MQIEENVAISQKSRSLINFALSTEIEINEQIYAVELFSFILIFFHRLQLAFESTLNFFPPQTNKKWNTETISLSNWVPIFGKSFSYNHPIRSVFHQLVVVLLLCVFFPSIHAPNFRIFPLVFHISGIRWFSLAFPEAEPEPVHAFNVLEMQMLGVDLAYRQVTCNRSGM